MRKKVKGALVIEATIGFTVFLCFMFMLLAVVRLSMVYITINDVTAETAKRVAGMSYPISFVNDIYDDKVSDVEEKIDKYTNVETYFNKISSSNSGDTSILQTMGLSGASSTLNESVIGEILGSVNSLGDNLVNTLLERIESFVIDKQQDILYNIYIDLLDDTGVNIDSDNIRVVYFSLPMAEKTFDHQKENMAEKTGLDADDLDKDNVVLVIEYDYTFSLPFLPSYDVALRSTAIEKAWMDGGNHTTPSKREGIDISSLVGKTVYYTASGNGHKYHKKDCITLMRSGSNVTPTTVDHARKSVEKGGLGLEACKVCKPDEPDDE